MKVEANILTEAGFVQGHLFVNGPHINKIQGEWVSEPQAQLNGLPWLVPGFIDCHVHGGGGFDVMEGAPALEHITQVHARHGTTALLATTLTSPQPSLASTFSTISSVMNQAAQSGSTVLGVHLEGPYINPDKLGAQPDFARPFELDELLSLHATAPIRVITLAPEVTGHMDAIGTLLKLGIKVQQGHSLSTYDQAMTAFELGAKGFTHLFNAMSGVHHRQPGMVGAALAHAEYAEIIPDLIHVHAGAIKTAARCIPKLFTVTDATAATGMPDGSYRLGSQQVFKCMGCVKLPNGTLAGSVLTMDQAFRNWVELGFSLAQASHKTSRHAADYLGEYQRGRIRQGLIADLVLLDKQLNVQHVWIKGVSV